MANVCLILTVYYFDIKEYILERHKNNKGLLFSIKVKYLGGITEYLWVIGTLMT